MRFLITGGSGFLGRHLARSLRDQHEVVLLGRNNKQNQEAERSTGCRAIPGDVANIESVRDALREVAPDIVVHAAATKFVDLAENQPLECIDVNVVGSENVARAAMDTGVRAVIGISTDKATPPVRNTYGLTKALMERLFCSLDPVSDTSFVCVRYGNVAWSTGSVLPVWRRMHEATGVIGTTGPDMRRFFFTVDEAVALVEAAVARVDELHGRVLSRQMKAARIGDLLDVWVRDHGGTWEQIEGRPGEREDELLVGELELPYAREIVIDDVPHYVLSFNQRVDQPLAGVLSSANAARLTDPEMAQLINSPPAEGL